MAQQRDLRSTIVSAVIGATFATVVLFVFFTYFGKQTPPTDASPTPTPAAGDTPKQPPNVEIPNPEIRATDVSSLSIDTVYKGYFDAADKCSRSYNEYFGNDDGSSSPSSPCVVKVTFDRDGHASRLVEVSRWDKVAKQKRVVERTDSTADVTAEQFNGLAQAIVANEAFRSWREGTMINVSNCKISVTYPGGVRSPMSNVSEQTTGYLQMVEAFKQLEKQLAWKPTK